MDTMHFKPIRFTFAGRISLRRSLGLGAVLVLALAGGPAWGRGGGGGGGHGGGFGGGGHFGGGFGQGGHPGGGFASERGGSISGWRGPGVSHHFDGDGSPHLEHDRRIYPYLGYDPYNPWFDQYCDPYSLYYNPLNC